MLCLGAAICVSIALQSGPLGAGLQTREQSSAKWETSLKQAVRDTDAVIFFDVNLQSQPPSVGTLKGEQAMQALAWDTSRRWVQAKGIQVFTRTLGKNDVRSISRAAHATAWLQSLSKSDLQQLEAGTFSLSGADNRWQDVLRYLASANPGMGTAMAENGDRLGIRVQLAPSFEYINPKTGKKARSSLPLLPTSPSVPIAAGLAAGKQPSRALAKPSEGPLDFGDGSILTLQEIATKAKAQLGVDYTFDRRLAESSFFVSGKLDAEAFEEAMAVLTTTTPWAAQDARRDQTSRGVRDLLSGPLSALQDVAFEGLRGDEFVRGQEVSLSELFDRSPRWESLLGNLGLGRNDKITLVPSLWLILGTEGSRPLPGATSGNGQPVSVGNQTIIPIG